MLSKLEVLIPVRPRDQGDPLIGSPLIFKYFSELKDRLSPVISMSLVTLFTTNSEAVESDAGAVPAGGNRPGAAPRDQAGDGKCPSPNQTAAARCRMAARTPGLPRPRRLGGVVPSPLSVSLEPTTKYLRFNGLSL